MSAAARRLERQRIRFIKAQWVLILILLVTLFAVSITQPSAIELAEPSTVENEELEVTDEQVKPAYELICLGEFKLTAYCSCIKCCGVWSEDHPTRVGTDYIQKTSSGTIPKEGQTIAVDPEVIPIGSVVVIDGHEYIAEDTGSAINQNGIDIYFESHEDAVNFGVQYEKIYIKKEI